MNDNPEPKTYRINERVRCMLIDSGSLRPGSIEDLERARPGRVQHSEPVLRIGHVVLKDEPVSWWWRGGSEEPATVSSTPNRKRRRRCKRKRSERLAESEPEHELH